MPPSAPTRSGQIRERRGSIYSVVFDGEDELSVALVNSKLRLRRAPTCGVRYGFGGGEEDCVLDRGGVADAVCAGDGDGERHRLGAAGCSLGPVRRIDSRCLRALHGSEAGAMECPFHVTRKSRDAAEPMYNCHSLSLTKPPSGAKRMQLDGSPLQTSAWLS